MYIRKNKHNKRKNSIKREYFEFICVVHKKDIDYHINVLFCDKFQKVEKSFLNLSISNKIRKRYIKNSNTKLDNEFIENIFNENYKIKNDT